ncbi:MAG: glycerol dehydrogenase [Bacillota bacterium]|nr:glycerol dehydrogenase [Bacillota bacterium]MDK2856538.1 glycerol dehydrogenase [Bacillota bacterium]MDK2926116.1 glycerol dehydrogenase [Bacillota bacterium]
MEVKPAPGRYVRQGGALRMIGAQVKQLGRRPLIVGGRTALGVAEAALMESLNQSGLEPAGTLWYGGQCSAKNIERMVKAVQREKADFLIGVGGGKAIDTVKAAAAEVNLPLVTVPTIAATCAAWTGVAVYYTDEGAFLALKPAASPALVLVDTDIIARAPVRFLCAGMGDTLAKWVELSATFTPEKRNASTEAAYTLARLTLDVLFRSGAKAKHAVLTGIVTPALEEVIDAVIMLSGSVSGYGGDACRTGAAHAIYSGLTVLPAVHRFYHGELVAFGVLAQLALEGKRWDEVQDYLSFLTSTGLPTTLAEIGLAEATRTDLEKVAAVSAQVEDMFNMPYPVTAAMVLDALYQADAWGKKWQKEEGKK